MTLNKQYVSEIQELLKLHKLALHKIIVRPEYKHLLDYINEWCAFMNEVDHKFKFRTKVWYTVNAIDDFVRCRNPNCKKKLVKDIITYVSPGLKYCSHECKKSDPILNMHLSEVTKSFSEEKKKLKNYRRQETNLKLYGEKNYRNDSKREETLQHHYGQGITNPFQATEVKQQIAQTNMMQYGVSSYAQCDEFIKKIEATNMKNYGVPYYSQTDESKERIKATCLSTYGSVNPMGNEDVRAKSRATCQRNYGCDNPTQCREVFLKQRCKYDFHLSAVHSDLSGEVTFDSIPEMAFYVYCIDNDLSVQYQPSVSFNYEFNEKIHVYYPDFQVGDQIIEIKGDQFFLPDGSMTCPYHRKNETEEQYIQRCALYEAKHQCMLRNSVLIFRSSECKKYISYVDNKYGKDFLQQFKRSKQ